MYTKTLAARGKQGAHERPGNDPIHSPPEVSPAPLRVQSIVRRLVKQVAAEPRGSEAARVRDANGTESEVLLDIELDGFRCILLHPAAPSAAATGEDRVTLSPREREIARMIAQGHPNKTIARVLEISTWTVGTHLRRIFAKLGVGSRAAMVARLLDAGFTRRQGVPPEQTPPAGPAAASARPHPLLRDTKAPQFAAAWR